MASRYSKLVRDALANKAQGSKQKPINSTWKDPTTLLLKKPQEQQHKAAVNKENDAPGRPSAGRSGWSEHNQGTGKFREVRHSMDNERIAAHSWEHRGEMGDNTPLVRPVQSEKSHRTVEEEQRFAEQLQAEKRREARKRKRQEAAEEARREFDFEAHWKKAKEREADRERKTLEEEEQLRVLRELRERQRAEGARQRAEAAQKYARYQEAQQLRAQRETQRRRQKRDPRPEPFLKAKFHADPCHFHCKMCGGRCCTGCQLWGDFDLDCSWAMLEPCCCDTQQFGVESDSDSYYDSDTETESNDGVEDPFLNYRNLFAAALRPVSNKAAPAKQEAERLLSLAEAQLKDRKRGPETSASREGDTGERDMDSVRDQMVKELKAAVRHQTTLWGMLCALKVIQLPAGTGVPRLAAFQIERLKRLALAKLHPDKQARASLRDRILAEERFKIVNNFVTST